MGRTRTIVEGHQSEWLDGEGNRDKRGDQIRTTGNGGRRRDRKQMRKGGDAMEREGS